MTSDCLLIDGSGFVYRAYYGYPKLFRGDGTQVGAVYGFCSMLLPLLKKTKAKYLAIAFDNGRHTFRTDKYPDYKANRAQTPDDLIPQFEIIRNACNAFGITILSKDGVEADDIIATFTRKFSENNYSVEIVSSDKDLCQLICDNVCIFDPMKSKYIYRKEAYEKFGVFPEQIRDYLALVGDTSDNVPGVEGIGPKTAAKLLEQFEDINGILCNLHCINSKKIAQRLENSKDKISLSQWLVTLKDDVELDISINNLLNNGIMYNSIYDFCIGNGFMSLAKKLTQ